MSNFIYPGGDQQVTPFLGLATWGMDEVLAENMILIDAAVESGGGIASGLSNNGNTVVLSTTGITCTDVVGNIIESRLIAGFNQIEIITPQDAGISILSNASRSSVAVSDAQGNALLLGGDTNQINLTNALQTAGFVNAVGSTEFQIIGNPILLNGTVDIGGTDTGLSRISAGALGVGNGTAGDTSGTLALTTQQFTASASAPTSAATAGTAGQMIYHGALLYICTVTGAAGAATWNKVNLTAV